MTDKEKLLEIDDLILDMELNQEKARVMASNLDQGYFDLTKDTFKLFYFEKASTEFDILFDYVFENVELLRKVRELLNGEEAAECRG